jgi:hypothetical protein
VRIIDVIGSINPNYGTLDSEGNLINDLFPTPFYSGGFDLDAVGVLHEVDSELSLFETQNLNLDVYPNPSQGRFYINFINSNEIHSVQIYDCIGRNIPFTKNQNTNYLEIFIQDYSGLLYVHIFSGHSFCIKAVLIGK